MNKHFSLQIVAFVTLVLSQCFIFSRLPLGTYVHPCIYILFIMHLPFGYSRIHTLLWAFFLGLSVDLLSMDVFGVHTASTVALAYMRHYILRFFSPKIEFDTYSSPSSHTLGWRLNLGYILITVVLHHMIFFFFDVFGFHDYGHTILRILLSSSCSIVLILLLQVFLFRNRESSI